MPNRYRIATFNCENLFNRAKVLNLRSHEDTGALLDQVAKLEGLLQKDTYNPATKAAILKLAKELSPYVDIAEDRGKLFTGTGANRRITASGRGGWDGGIVFRRASFKDQQREMTAKVIAEVDADIQALVEVEDRLSVDAFSRQLLASQKFEFNMVVDGFDPRGIDVGALSKYPIVGIRTHIFDRDADGRVFSRDCLELDIQLKAGRTLHLLVNHFKSQGYGDASSNNAKRLRQAKAVRKILGDQYDLSKDLVALVGDFNDSPSSAPLAPVIQLQGLNDVLASTFPNAADRWTYHYRKNEQIDFILVSDALHQCLRDAGVERRGMPRLSKNTVSGEIPFSGVTGTSTAASDHAAVWADFVI